MEHRIEYVATISDVEYFNDSKATNVDATLKADTLDRAVEVASRRARPGDVVLLAPACASFDQFENYEQRGRVFKQLVRELEKKHAA